MSREQRRENKRARRRRRLAARNPGSPAHHRALAHHRTLGGSTRDHRVLDDEAARAVQREARRLLGHAHRIQDGADRMDKMIEKVQSL